MTLLSTPTYAAAGLIEVRSPARGQGFVEELDVLSQVSQVSAEMEIMRSRSVADAAAAKLGKERGMSDFLLEVDEFRPFEVLMRALRGSPPACDVELTSEPLPDGSGTELFRFRFVERLPDGRLAVDVGKVRKHRFRTDRSSERVDIVPGKPFTSFERRFTLQVEGNVIGREFEIELRSLAAISSWLRGGITVTEVGRSTGIISLGFKASTPRRAQQGARALAEAYVETKRTKKHQDASRAVTFLKEQVAANEARLSEVERALDTFRQENGVTLLSERARELITNISRLEREVAELEARRSDLADQLARVRAGEDVLLAGAGDTVVDGLSGQLAELEAQRASLGDDLTDRHPDVRGLDRRVAALRKQLRERTELAIETAGAQVDKSMQRARESLEELHRVEADLPEKERTLAQLTRKTTSLLSIHNFLLEKQHEAAIARELVFSNVDVVDLPSLPDTRTSPNLLINVLVCGFLATLAALATAFFAEYLDRSIKSPEDLEQATGLPLFAALPAFHSIKSSDTRKLKSQMVTIEKPQSALAEGYRTLRANIRFAEFEGSVRTVAITSAVLGEGKTTTSLNLAVVLAQAGAKVVVVDADMRRPATHSHLKSALTPGLTDIITRGADWRAVRVPVPGVETLHVIHAGKKPPNPGALIDSERFAGLFEELRAEYDYVIFDVPPVLAVADAASLFRQLDAVFLLVQWRRCPVDVVLAARDQIQHVGAKLRGVLLNGFDARKVNRRGYGRYGYYGYYGYYGRGSYGRSGSYFGDGKRDAEPRPETSKRNVGTPS
jgi:capsular exopolysaccharide synthesis family protein